MAIFMGFALLGLVAVVRGRGRVAVIAAAVVTSAGLPAHAVGAAFNLVAVQLLYSGLSVADQVRAITPIYNNVGPVYFIGLVPYLVGLFLVPAAMWRARMVSWAPLALLVVGFAYQTFIGDPSSNSVLRGLEPVIPIAAYAWLGLGYLRYRPASASTKAESAPLAA